MQANPDVITKLDEALPLNGKIMSLHLIMEKIASDAGVTLDNKSFGAPSDVAIAGNKDLITNLFASKRSLKRITGNVSVKASLAQVQTFIQKLEESGRIFDLVDLRLDSQDQGEMGMSATLNTYYFGP